MASIAASQFRCDPIEFAFNETGRFNAAQSYYFECGEMETAKTSSARRVYILAVWGLVAYALLVPMALALTMHMGKRHFDNRQALRNSIQQTGSTSDDTQRGRSTLRHGLSEKALSVFDVHMEELEKEKATNAAWSDFLIHKDRRYLYLLMGAYRAKFWYWELIEIMRKLCLTALFVWVNDEVSDEQQSPVPIALAIVVSLLALELTASMRPYKEYARSWHYKLSGEHAGRNCCSRACHRIQQTVLDWWHGVGEEKLVRTANTYKLSLFTTTALVFVLLSALLLKMRHLEAQWYDERSFSIVLVALLLAPPFIGLFGNRLLNELGKTRGWAPATCTNGCGGKGKEEEGAQGIVVGAAIEQKQVANGERLSLQSSKKASKKVVV
jgi:hypothetical protein